MAEDSNLYTKKNEFQFSSKNVKNIILKLCEYGRGQQPQIW